MLLWITILSYISGYASLLAFVAMCFITKVSSRAVRVKFTYCVAPALCFFFKFKSRLKLELKFC